MIVKSPGMCVGSVAISMIGKELIRQLLEAERRRIKGNLIHLELDCAGGPVTAAELRSLLREEPRRWRKERPPVDWYRRFEKTQG